MSRVAWQRILLVLVALVVGWFALPLTALFLDTVLEGGLLVVALVGAVGVCAGVGALLPEAAGAGAPRIRGALLGAALGAVATLVCVVVLFVLIAG